MIGTDEVITECDRTRSASLLCSLWLVALGVRQFIAAFRS
jgi:hypothetical protein